MADVKPLKLVDQGAGVGRLAEFEAGDTLPKAALPALSAADVGAVAAGDPRLSDAREWTAETVSQAEAEAGTATTRRAWTAQRVRQAVVAWWNSVSSAWGRSFVSSADANAGRTALGLGNAATATVQTSANDTTAGALMSVGAFGLGSAALYISPDLDFELRSSFFRVDPNTLNRPPALNFGHAVVCSTNAEAAQSVIDIVTGDLWTRKLQAGVGWSNWRKHFHTGNILGTVSQSAGIPTGAIIERGSNANGEYVKFADGMMFCRTVRYVADAVIKEIALPATIAGNVYDASVFVTTIPYQSHEAAYMATCAYSHAPTTAKVFFAGVSYNEFTVTVIGRWY